MNIAANALPLRAGDKILMIHGDHPNNAYAFLNLQKKGVEIVFIPMTEIVDAESFRPHIDERTRAISMSHVTFHAGHRFNVESVGELCAQHSLYFVVDVMQAIGVVPIDAKAMKATFIGSGTHKGLLVPQGLGLLYGMRRGSNWSRPTLRLQVLPNHRSISSPGRTIWPCLRRRRGSNSETITFRPSRAWVRRSISSTRSASKKFSATASTSATI